MCYFYTLLLFMKKLLLACCFIQCVLICLAQPDIPVTFKNGMSVARTRNGIFSFQQFEGGVIKITWRSVNMLQTEQVSDAVIAKPLPNQQTAEYLKRHEATIHFKNDQYVTLHESNVSVHTAGAHIIHIAHVFDSLKTRGFVFTLQPGEQIFGGGERALPLNRRGYRLSLYNNPWYGYENGADALNYSVPFFTSSKGYGLLFDNPSKGYADIGKNTDTLFEAGFSSGELSVYIIPGNNYADILRKYHVLTGTQPLPPRWAMGNFMSRFGYTSQQQTLAIADSMRLAGIPFDAVIFDLFWFGDSIKKTLGNLDWVNKTKWPDPAGMISDLKRNNINTLLITEPFVVNTAKTFVASKPFHAVTKNGQPYLLTDFYFGPAGIIDIFRADARQWFWSHYKKQMNKGVEAWWGDLGEPEKHPADLYHNLKDRGFKRLFAADEVHNLYGHTWTKMLYTQYQKEYPGKRLFSLNRSGFAGTQRFSIFPWTGDVSRSWKGLQAQLPVLLGMSMSGVPYVHSDAGGFAGGEGDPELYIRWLQMAAYTPVFRPHGTALYAVDPAAYSYPSEPALQARPYREKAAAIVANRYRMLPYNYNLAYEQAAFGKPLIAPMYYYYPDDTLAYKAQAQFMWGENLLVAPVLEKNATVKTLYLPAGKWFMQNHTSTIAGGVWKTDAVTLDEIPVYVKAGSFLPYWLTRTPIATTQDFTGDSLRMQYYPSVEKTVYRLFSDDGKDANSIRNSAYELLTFTGQQVGSKLLITIETNRPAWYAKGRVKYLQLELAAKVLSGKINGTTLSATDSATVIYGGKEGMFGMVGVKFAGKKLIVEINGE